MRLLLTIAFLLLFPLNAMAAECPKAVLDENPGAICLDNPLGNKISAQDVMGGLIKGALTVLGSLTLLMMVWGGFQWLTSAGNSDKVDAGKSTMIWAIIGVIVVFSSFILINTLTDLLNKGN